MVEPSQFVLSATFYPRISLLPLQPTSYLAPSERYRTRHRDRSPYLRGTDMPTAMWYSIRKFIGADGTTPLPGRFPRRLKLKHCHPCYGRGIYVASQRPILFRPNHVHSSMTTTPRLSLSNHFNRCFIQGSHGWDSTFHQHKSLAKIHAGTLHIPPFL